MNVKYNKKKISQIHIKLQRNVFCYFKKDVMPALKNEF